MRVTQDTIDALDGLLEERLEADIIANVAERLGASTSDAMKLYYGSKLARQIEVGSYGIQYLDAKVLTDMLLEEQPVTSVML